MSSQTEIERATLLLQQGQPQLGAVVLGAVVAREPGNAAAAHLLGLALKDCDDWKQGEQWIRFSIDLDPLMPEFHANLANLLRRKKDYGLAELSYRRATELAPDHRPARRGLALTLNDLDCFDAAEEECQFLLDSDPIDAEAWVILGLVLTNRGQLPPAEAAYRRAIALNPDNMAAHNNLGALMLRMQRPEAAIDALTSARLRGETNYELAFNRGRALLELNDLDAAEKEFDSAVMLQPTNTEAQLHLARLRFMRGEPKFARALAAAAAANRDDVELQLLLGQLLWRAGNLQAAETLMHDLLRRKGPSARAHAALAGMMHEQGLIENAEAYALQAASAAPNDSAIIETLVAVLLARGHAQDAMPFILTQRRKNPQSQVWIAYEATAARLLGIELYHRYFDFDRLVRVFNVETPAGWGSMGELNNALIEILDKRHAFSQRPLDQTIQNGTQTSRTLLGDSDPSIQSILQAFDEPIRQYRRDLQTDLNHPMSSRNFGASEFTGAWSVRLKRNGFHVNHVHPEGWLSSAYYVQVPPETQDSIVKPGWLKFGEPRYPVPGAHPELYVQPVPGRLVLFPSYMWHGTKAIVRDEPRTTIAFDVRPVGAQSS